MMFDQYATLALSNAVPAQRERTPLSPVEASLSPASPALMVLQDFRQHPPALLPDRLNLEQASELFRVIPLRYLVVENASGDFQGILTAEAVLGPQRMMLTRLHQALPRDLSVRELMIPRHRLLSVSYSALRNACVGDVLNTLEANGEPFLCVHEGDTTRAGKLRGMLCGRDIAEQLGLPWSPTLRARSFSELRATLFDKAVVMTG